MPYLVVTDFKFGMDRRRQRVAGAPGTLWTGKNVHITRGADIERRRKFTPDFHVPGTFGAFALNSQLYVFGSADLASSMPLGVQYQRLAAPGGAAMTAVIDVKAFDGKLYAIAEYDDGNIYHFYDGARVTDWDQVASAGASFEAVANALAQLMGSNNAVDVAAAGQAVTFSAKKAGTPFSVLAHAIDGGVTEAKATAKLTVTDGDYGKATITIVDGSASAGNNQITAVHVNGGNLISSAVDWGTSNADTAAAIVTAINAGTGTHGYSASSSGATVSITPPAGVAYNVDKVSPVVTVTGDVKVSTEAFVGGTLRSLRIGSVGLLDTVVDWGVSHTSTAAAIRDSVNAGTSTHGYTATASGAVVTITAPTGSGAGVNGNVLTATVAGQFTVSTVNFSGGVTKSTDDQAITLTTTQANVTAVEEVKASAAIQITGGTASAGVNRIAAIRVNGVHILDAPVDWAGSNASTAIKLQNAILNGYATHGFSAAAIGDVVTVSAAPGTGASRNGQPVAVTTEGDVTVSADGQLSGGVTAVASVAQIVRAVFSGTFDVSDTFTITLDGVDYTITGRAAGTGRSLFVATQRVWSPVGSVWRYCSLNRGDVWDANRTDVEDNDAGFINVASETEGNESLVVAARYQGLAAIFSQSSVTLFQLDVDPSHNALSDYLENTGTLAPGSVVRYGNNDVFYLDITGIRSLRARDASNAPFVSDIGNAIDTFVQEYVDSLPAERLRRAIAAIEPRDGRFWLAAGDLIFVLSYFPGARISAWTYYEPTEFGGADVQAIVRAGQRIHVRAGDYVYTYGGLNGATYPNDDEVPATVELPFLAGKTAATIKSVEGFDIAASNTWACQIACDPNDENRLQEIGRIDRITFADDASIRLPGQTSMFAPVLTCTKAGPATISMLAVHYEAEDSD